MNDSIFTMVNENTKTYCDDTLEVTICGVAILLQPHKSICDVLHISHMITEDNIDFNQLHGFFKILIHDMRSNTFVFLGDNSGSQFFYIDGHKNRVSDSFLALIKNRNGNLNPNFAAISQFLRYSRIVTGDTIVDGITETDSAKYYTVQNFCITERSKNLKSFNDQQNRVTLKRLMSELCDAANNDKICSVCTGGTDSRTILSHLIANGKTPQLVLTGHSNNPDIPIAAKISDTVGLPLDVLNPDIRCDNWLIKGFTLSDGAYDSALSYRHWLKAIWAKEHGYKYEFGGVGGEFYKNAFCTPFRYGYYFKQLTSDILLKYLYPNCDYSPTWLGEPVKMAISEERRMLLDIISKNNMGPMLCRFNAVGFVNLSHGFAAITNGYSSYCTKIDPLMDRDIIASVCSDSVVSHSMQLWQRKEIASNCPILSDIPTDQGLSCSLKKGALFAERTNQLLKYVSLAVGRIKRKLGISKKEHANYWEEDYLAASKSAVYTKALKKCRDLGIVANNISEDAIPIDKCGKIVTIGLVFSDFYKQ